MSKRPLICRTVRISAIGTGLQQFHFPCVTCSCFGNWRLTAWKLKWLNIPHSVAFPVFGRIMKNRSFQTGYVLLLLVCWRLLCGFCSTRRGTISGHISRSRWVCLSKLSAAWWDTRAFPPRRFTPVRPEWSLNKYFFSKKLGLGSI